MEHAERTSSTPPGGREGDADGGGFCEGDECDDEWMLTNGANFELFTHVTRFCGQKVILLG